MDYKTRFPVLPRWTVDVFSSIRNPMPFIDPGYGDIQELDAPDNSTVFLSIGAMIANAEMEGLVYYFIEAPPSCPMRKAFELGALSYDDFIEHRGWLIRLETTVMGREDPKISYVRPNQVHKRIRWKFCRFGNVSPYQRLFDGLVKIRGFNKNIGEDCAPIDKEIEELLRLHGDKIAVPAVQASELRIA